MMNNTNLKMKVVAKLCVFCFLLFGFTTTQAQKTFTSAVDNDWNKPGNWSPAGVPTALDDVLINGNNVSLFSSNTAAVMNNLTIEGGGLIIIPSSLLGFTVNGTTTLNATGGGGDIRINNTANSFVGTITINVGCEIRIQSAGRLNASGSVIVFGSMGTLAGDFNFGSLIVNSSIQLSGSATGVDFTGGSITLNGGAYIDFNNRPSTTVNFSGNIVDLSGSSNAFQNTTNVTFRASGGGVGQIFYAAVSPEVTSVENLIVGANSNLAINNNADVSTAVTINTGATLSLAEGGGAPVAALDLTGVTFSNAGTLAISTGDVTFGSLAPSSGSITIDDSGSFTGTSFTLPTGTSTLTATGAASISLSSFVNNRSAAAFVPGGSTVTFTGASPSISGSFGSTFNNIVINSGASFSSSNNLTINGSFTNNGNAISFASNTITFAGSGTLDGGTSGTSFNDITISTTGNIAIERKVDLNGVLTLQGSGVFDADGAGSGVFTVKSTSQTAGGRIANLPAPVNFSGNLIIERYLHSGGVNGDYRFLSVPINTASTPISLGLWKSTFGVTGNFSDPSNYAVTDGGGNFASIQAANNTSPSVSTYNGTAYSFLASIGNSVNTVQLSGTTGYAAYNFASSPVTLSYPGEIQKGQVDIPLNSGGTAYSLVPNPYPSPIDWDNVTLPGNLSASLYLRTSSNTYATFVQGAGSATGAGAASLPPGWAGEIATGQSFFVQNSGANPGPLQFFEDDKTLSTNNKFARTADNSPKNILRVALKSETQRDESLIRFVEGATDGRDRLYDASKLKNGVLLSPVNRNSYVNVSSYNTGDASSSDLAVNTIAPLSTSVQSKDVNLIVADLEKLTYTLILTPQDFNLGYRMILVDNFLKKEVDFSKELTYSFTVTDDPLSSGSARFKVSFVNSITAVLDEPESNFQIYPNPVVKDKFTVVTPALFAGKVKSISILDMSGHALAVEDQLDSSEVTFDVSGYNSAVYIVLIKLSDNIFKSYRIIKR